MSYQATENKPGMVHFVNPVNGDVAQFTAKVVKVTTPSKATINMVNQDLLVQTRKAVVSECDPCGSGDVNNSVRVKCTFIQADAAQLTAMRVEVNRLMDLAIAQYNFTAGFVPPISATLSE